MSSGRSPRATGATAAARSQRAIAVLLVVVLAICALSLVDSARTAGVPGPARTLRLNPNTCTADELALLPDIGPVRAARLVEHRAAAGAPAYRDADDLLRIAGIGPATAARIAPFLEFDGTAPARAGATKEP